MRRRLSMLWRIVSLMWPVVSLIMVHGLWRGLRPLESGLKPPKRPSVQAGVRGASSHAIAVVIYDFIIRSKNIII